MGDTGVSVASHHVGEAAVIASADAGMTVGAHSPDSPAPADGCDGSCGPSHDMLGMICILALLVTVVLFTSHMVRDGWRPLKGIVFAFVAKAAALAPPPPPSLHVLSISRT